MDSDCQASGPYQMFEFLGDMVLFEQNQTTKVPPQWDFLPKGLQLHSQVLPQNPADHHASGMDGALFA